MPQRVLILTHEFPPFRGGIATYVQEIARAATKLGHEVTVLAPDFHEAANDSSLPFEVIRFPGGRYSLRRLPAILRLLSRVDTAPYDVVHAAEWPFLLGLALQKPFRGSTKFVATLYGSEILRNRATKLRRLAPLKRVYEAPDLVCTISNFTRTLLHQEYPEVQPAEVRVTPLGVDQYWFEPTTTFGLRDRYSIPAGKQLVLTVGRLDSRKGHLTALAAFDHLPSPLREACCYVIVGKPEDQAYHSLLLDRVKASGVPVVLTGPVPTEDLRALYALADVFCLPAEPDPEKIEGFGLVYLEAAAQALPSIGGRAGAVPEVVLDGDTGLLVKPRAPKDLADAIARLLTDDALRTALGARAREHAMTFTWESTARLTYGS